MKCQALLSKKNNEEYFKMLHASVVSGTLTLSVPNIRQYLLSAFLTNCLSKEVYM